MFDESRLMALASRHRDEYLRAEPFPNIVIDDFLPITVAEKILAEFPGPDVMDMSTYQHYERKIAMRPDNGGLPEYLRQVLYALNSHEMINFLEELTGIVGLIPDPHFHGAGLQQTMTGGKLGVHIDFNKHKRLNLDRRLNVLIYFNKGWQEKWAGAIELWDSDMSRCVKKALPVFNRCVIFSTSDISLHGLPDPIRCPKDITRKQLNLYYYSNGRDDRAAELDYHWTRHRRRPFSVNDYIKQSIERLFYDLTPPVITRLVQKRILSKGRKNN